MPGTITPYLACSSLIPCTDPAIRRCARDLTKDAVNETDLVGNLYSFVRDSIRHSGDSKETELVWKPEDILSTGHALCFGKSHLLAALCRVVGIPAGLCYQRILREDGSYVLHGLAAVHLEAENRWIRLDARGNKPGIDARFDPEGDEYLAYPESESPGEWFDPHVYAEPWDVVVQLYESSADVQSFIEGSAVVQTPPRHPYRINTLTPVPV
jgi:transglutaminase-like putative cysteine protease